LFWHELYIRDYGAHPDDEHVESWKEEYQTTSTLSWDPTHVDDERLGAYIFPPEEKNRFFYRDDGKSCCPKVLRFVTHFLNLLPQKKTGYQLKTD